MSSMEDTNSMDINKEELPDIDKLTSISDSDPLTHLNEGYVVRVHFGNDGYTASDAFKRYLQQVAELKY